MHASLLLFLTTKNATPLTIFNLDHIVGIMFNREDREQRKRAQRLHLTLVKTQRSNAGVGQ